MASWVARAVRALAGTGRMRADLKECNRSFCSEIADVGIVGGGILGMATARELSRRLPGKRLVLFEKEKELATHQTGHNSGVIHCGVYYKPGSLKARLCVRGNKLSYEYLKAKGIPFEQCGKLIVAVTEAEVDTLEGLLARGIQNGVPGLTLLSSPDDIRKEEPHCTGLAALKCETTGIVDWAEVTRSFAKDFELAGGEVYTSHKAESFEAVSSDDSTGGKHNVSITFSGPASKKVVQCKNIVVCAGLQADILAQSCGGLKSPQIVPFRGEYLQLKPEKRHLIKGNIYPVPDARFPFLGVHFTPRVDGAMLIGPNAVLAFAREGYRYSDVSLSELVDTVTSPGFLKLALKYPGYGASEFLRSVFLPLQLKHIQKYVPEISLQDLRRGPSGVRAQALDLGGNLVDDFAFDRIDSLRGKPVSMLHLRNAPSPAATSSLAIAEFVSDKALESFQL